jgi:hypothetical protein
VRRACARCAAGRGGAGRGVAWRGGAGRGVAKEKRHRFKNKHRSLHMIKSMHLFHIWQCAKLFICMRVREITLSRRPSSSSARQLLLLIPLVLVVGMVGGVSARRVASKGSRSGAEGAGADRFLRTATSHARACGMRGEGVRASRMSAGAVG